MPLSGAFFICPYLKNCPYKCPCLPRHKCPYMPRYTPRVKCPYMPLSGRTDQGRKVAPPAGYLGRLSGRARSLYLIPAKRENQNKKIKKIAKSFGD